MFFVVDRSMLQWNISLVRDDRTKKSLGRAGPFMRLEAKDNYLKLDGLEVSAQIPATVYEPGVLFLKVTIFRRLLKTIKGQPFQTIQVTADGLLMDGIRMPLEFNDMLLYSDPDLAPQHHPSSMFETPEPKSKPESKPEFSQLTLWNQLEGESKPRESEE